MLQNQENWRSVSGYLNYQVSDHGRIRNTNTGIILKQQANANGYNQISLYLNGKGKTYPIHRLVCFAFNSNPNNYPCVDHIDKNRSNNHYQNLRWCTISMNNKNKSKQINNFSGFTGISFDPTRNKWRARINVDGKEICKRFCDLDDAILYRKYLEQLHGFTNE